MTANKKDDGLGKKQMAVKKRTPISKKKTAETKRTPKRKIKTGVFNPEKAPANPIALQETESNERDRHLPVGDHLEELRKRLLWIAGTVCLAALLIGFKIYDIHEFLMDPYKTTVSARYPGGMNLILRNVPGPMIIMIKLSFMIGFSISLPISISILWGFITPAVSRFTAWIGHIVVGASSLLFWTGMFVCWKFIFPTALQFMLIDMLPVMVDPQLTLEDYYSFVLLLHVGSGLGFQLPLLLVVLGAFGILTLRWHQNYWKYIIVGVFVFAAIITPPDPVTQLFLAVPLNLLYFVSLIIVWFIEKSKRQKKSENIPA